MTRERLDKGRAAEARAEAWLAQQRLTPVARNWQGRTGEIDLVMREGKTLVFVEVRYRARRGRWGGALESMGPHKQARMLRAAQEYLAHHPGYSGRIDAVAIDGDRIEWIRNAVEA